MDDDTPESVLKRTFGYDNFRPLQREVIESVLQKKDTLAVLPTGGGKSLCYQLPAMIFPGLTVVVSPLIALMKDQVDQMQALGVPALFLNSSLTPEEYQRNMVQVSSGKIKLLYLAPEALLSARLFTMLLPLQIDCLTIDEAHCISEWGHDFRPEYRQLADVRRRFPQAACLALTATATSQVRTDIVENLHLRTASQYVASFNRENLLLEVWPKSDPAEQTLRFLADQKDKPGIIYCFSRKQVDELAYFLSGKGFKVRPYHAGMQDAERKRNQEAFIRDDVQIIVATIAFGMGINKSNVRFVLHYDLPKSIEGYYQEIGRAGRDGLPAHCLMLYSYGDVAKQRYFIDQKDEVQRKAASLHLDTLVSYAESNACRRISLLDYFGEDYRRSNCGMCDNCLAEGKNEVDITIPAYKLLSCVKRTGELFGSGYISDVLLGKASPKVISHNHQELSTFGIGKELPRSQWMDIVRQLVRQELLIQNEKFGSLKLTPKAYDVLKKKGVIRGVLERGKPAVQNGRRKGEIEYDKDLFDMLRQKRKALADAGRVPPYVVFSDRTLVEMAAYYPMSGESMLQINGVGQVKG